VVLNISPDCSPQLSPGESMADAIAQMGSNHPAAINAIGTGFPANQSGNFQIRTFLNGGVGFQQPRGWSTDQYGNYAGYFILPWLGSNFIPSTNTIQLVIGDGAYGEAAHSIPGPQSENC